MSRLIGGRSASTNFRDCTGNRANGARTEFSIGTTIVHIFPDASARLKTRILRLQ